MTSEPPPVPPPEPTPKPTVLVPLPKPWDQMDAKERRAFLDHAYQQITAGAKSKP